MGLFSKDIKTMNDLFVHALRDIYYAENQILKALPLERVTVELSHSRIHAADCETCETKEGMVDRIERTIALRGNLDAEQRERLLEIADKCPVHRTLTSEVDIRTIERRDADDEP